MALYKKCSDGTIAQYTPADRDKWVIDDINPLLGEAWLHCGCGSDAFSVSWWDYHYTGGYCKVKCTQCGEETILINDYA